MTAAILRQLTMRTPLGWRQLRRNPSRFVVALAGVVFADLLIFMQLGIMGSLLDAAAKPVRLLNADILLLSPEARTIGKLGTLPRRRLYQALGVDGVMTGSSLQVGIVEIRNPLAAASGSTTTTTASVMVFGLDPDFDGFTDPEISRQRSKLRLADSAILDRLTRQPFDHVAASMTAGERAGVEIAGRSIGLAGLYSLGASFESDGTMIVSDQTFLRLFPRNTASAASAMLLKTAPGADIDAVARRLRTALPASDTQVMTKPGYITFIKSYMGANTSIGVVFNAGVVIGCIIGFAIVYQILSADVNDHLAEYATFRAMGFSHSYLLGVVFEEALLLAGIGFVPGLLASLGLYQILGRATELAVDMPAGRAFLVFGLTLVMCCLSGAVATRRLRAADPADVF